MKPLKFDPSFISARKALEKFEEAGTSPLSIAISQPRGLIYVYNTKVNPDPIVTYPFLKRLLLTLVWMVGGSQIQLYGDSKVCDYLISKQKGDPEWDSTALNMEMIFSHPFSIVKVANKPQAHDYHIPLSDDFSGCRIGFDAGGSDRKVSAVKDGQVLYSEEVLWQPKSQKDFKYHYDGVVDSFRRAAKYLPHVDAIGVSTAGVPVDNEMAQCNLFFSLPMDKQINPGRKLYIDVVKNEFPDATLKVANDGDVTAMGGSFYFHKDKVLGLAMGTSLAAGYCINSSFNGWISELGKVPLNYASDAICHYATHISGAGSEYLSQKGIIRLCEKAGFVTEGTLPIRLLAIQEEAKKGNPTILEAYDEMGIYLGSALALYSKFLDIRSVLLLGRVMSGVGGEHIVASATAYLKENGYPNMDIFTPDEKFKRLGQSYLAASLPILNK
jgi:predicted NBD/HSP70 family sugar kinase